MQRDLKRTRTTGVFLIWLFCISCINFSPFTDSVGDNPIKQKRPEKKHSQNTNSKEKAVQILSLTKVYRTNTSREKLIFHNKSVANHITPPACLAFLRPSKLSVKKSDDSGDRLFDQGRCLNSISLLPTNNLKAITP